MPRILLVEDNALNRDILAMRLERKGHSVLTAGDGAEALRLGALGGFDVVLLDLSLPGIDGWEVTRRFKAGGVSANVPVIALTAHAMPGDCEKALDAACDDYDTKLIDFFPWPAKIEACLARGKAGG